MKIYSKFFGVIKLIISLLMFLYAIYTLVLMFSPKIYDTYIASIMYKLSPFGKLNVDAIASLSIIVVFLIYSLIGVYYLFSGLYEIKSKKPLHIALRIIVNFIPAISFLIVMILMFAYISDSSSDKWSIGTLVVGFLILPLMAVVFWREMWLGKIYKKKNDLTNTDPSLVSKNIGGNTPLSEFNKQNGNS